jgi:hypothetical protein
MPNEPMAKIQLNPMLTAMSSKSDKTMLMRRKHTTRQMNTAVKEMAL